MPKGYHVGKLLGLDLYLLPSFFLGTILLWAGLSGIGIAVFDFQIEKAIIGGLAGASLYWISGMVHYLGHAYAAERTGYPMAGIRLGRFLLLGITLFPNDEPVLPGRIHVRRALGGPIGSLAAAIASGIAALALRSQGGILWWLAVFFFLSNLVVYVLGALLPLGFTDGSTLLAWRNKP